MKRALLAFLLTPFMASSANANPRRIVQHCNAPIIKIVEKAAVVVEKVAAIAVPVTQIQYVPLYQSYYTPPTAVAPSVNAAGVADNGELTNAIKVLVEQMKLMNARLDRIEGGMPTMPPADKPSLPGDPFNPQQARIGSGFASCVQCHKPGGEGTKGPKGITLFDAKGAIVPGVEAHMMDAVIHGRMPRGNPFDEPKAREFMAGMSSHLKKGKVSP